MAYLSLHEPSASHHFHMFLTLSVLVYIECV